jgi:hypothetical protein
MKIIISENQELDVKKKFIFMLLNNKNYNFVEIGDRIYFVKNIGDKYAEIRYDKNNGWCDISSDLISFLSTITGFKRTEVRKLIPDWAEHTLQMEVTGYISIDGTLTKVLSIPYKWR